MEFLSAETDPIDGREPRGHAVKVALVLIAISGMVLRLAPLFRAGGPLAHPIDYDEGVYFAASSLLFRGVLPYRDFVFVHPPGLLYSLGVTSVFTAMVDAATAFAASRVVAATLGAVNIFLVGCIAYRWTRTMGVAMLAAALYATYPEVVVVERGPFLEPVLNLLCLSVAYLWLAPQISEVRGRGIYAAGALAGAATAVKVWGGIWLLAALASPPTVRRRHTTARFAIAAALAGFVLVAPLALAAPENFVTDVFLFHAWRPPDGDVARWPRLAEIWSTRHLTVSGLAMLGLFNGGVLASERRSRELRFFAVAYLLSIASFLSASAYWSQYNAHLAASEAVLAAYGAARMWRRAKSWWPARIRGFVGVAASAALVFPSARYCLVRHRSRSPEMLALGEVLRSSVPAGECVFAFEPAWGIVGGHLPPHRIKTAPTIVDSYGAMLLDATRGGARYADATAAFKNPDVQRDVRALLAACRFVVLGWRGEWQLDEETKAWVRVHFVRRHILGAGGLDLWERAY